MIRDLFLIKFNKHYIQIKVGGIKVLYLKTKNFILGIHRLFLFIIAFFGVLFLIIFSLFKKIQIGSLRTDKIGEFAIRAEIFILKKKNIDKNKSINLIFRDKIISNKFLYKLYKKKIYFLPNIIFNEIYILIKFFKLHKLCYNSLHDNIDRNLLLKKFKTQVSLQNSETKILNNFLNNLKINNRKLVCLTIRDNAYYGKSAMTEYRNSDIRKCSQAINYLIKKGYFVIRMGRKTNKKLKIKSKFYFDYSQSNCKSDELDILIASTCSFCISSGTGFDSIVRIFRKPILFINYVPYIYFPSEIYNSQILFKNIYTKQKNKKLKLLEILRSGVGALSSDIEIKKYNVIFKENSSEQILKAVKEFEKKFKLNKSINIKYSKLDYKFIQTYLRELKYTHFMHNYRHFKATVSRFFLKEII